MLFLDVNRELKTCLIEEYSNEEKPTDGEIYRKIRQYHFQRNLSFERRWWTRLTPHRTKNLKQLFRHDELTAAFDALLDIPGLWDGMRISTLHKMMAIKCDEVSRPSRDIAARSSFRQQILCYLDHIKEIWFTLLQRDENAMRLVDHTTVKALELKAPRASTLDAETLRGQVLGGEIFSAFSEQDRVGIWGRLQATTGLIPSLFTLFENMKTLEVNTDCVKCLISLSPRDTVSTALERAFTDANQRTDQAVVQVTESTFMSRPAGLADRVDLGCRQLYAYAMRHFLDMPRESNGKDLLARLTIKADRTVLRAFADLASRLGFESPEISALKLYPSSMSAAIGSRPSNALLVTDGPGETKKARCGLPRVVSYKADSKFLFIDNLHDNKEEQAEGITSYFVRKSVYLKFYGRPKPTVVVSPTGNPNIVQHFTTGIRNSSPLVSEPDPSAYLQQEDYQPQGGPEHMEEDAHLAQDENEQIENAHMMRWRQDQDQLK